MEYDALSAEKRGEFILEKKSLNNQNVYLLAQILQRPSQNN